MPEAKKVAKNTKLNLLNLKMANLSANVITSENSDSDLKWNLKKTIFDTKKMPKYTLCFSIKLYELLSIFSLLILIST